MFVAYFMSHYFIDHYFIDQGFAPHRGAMLWVGTAKALRRPIWSLIAALVLAWPATAADLPGEAAALVMRLAADGPALVTQIDFPELRDVARAGRSVPMKLHLPQTAASAPLVILSHGAGGSRDANFAQSHHLASHGYAVLALEHPGSATARLLAGGRYLDNLRDMTRDADEVLGRPRDVSFALDMAARWQASHPAMQGRLDLTRVAVMGHSFGAYTALVACGARPARDWLVPVVAPGQGLVSDLADARVKACVALSPQGPGAPFFTEASYASLNRPVLGITGSADQPQGGGSSQTRRRAFELAPPGGQWLVWLANAEHSAFSDPTGSGRRGLPSTTRADAQPISRAATLAFLDLQLRGRTEMAAQLTEAGLRPLLRGRIDAVEVLHK